MCVRFESLVLLACNVNACDCKCLSACLQSKPNWETVFTGATPEEHGVTSNYWYPTRCEHYGVPDPECIACQVCHTIIADMRALMGTRPIDQLNRTRILEQLLPQCEQWHYWNEYCEQHVQISYDYLAINRNDESDICITRHVDVTNDIAFTPCRRLLTSRIAFTNNDVVNNNNQHNRVSLRSADTDEGKSSNNKHDKDINVTYPTLFGIAKQHGLSTLCYHDWDSIYALIEDNVLDHKMFGNSSESVVSAFESLLSQSNSQQQQEQRYARHLPSVSFLYFGDIDEAGHEYGWGSPEYLDAVHSVDSKIARVLRALESSHHLHKTLVLVVADHGGDPGSYDHGYTSDDYEVMVPFVAFGPGIVGRPGNGARLADVAPTVLNALGINVARDLPLMSGRVLTSLY